MTITPRSNKPTIGTDAPTINDQRAAVTEALRSAYPHLMSAADERFCVAVFEDDYERFRSLFTNAHDFAEVPEAADPATRQLFDDVDFCNGTMFAHGSVKDAVLFDATAQAAGFRTALLLDVEGPVDLHPFMVLTSLQCDCQPGPV